MPIYEYECAKCGRTIEVIQKMSDKPLKKHEGCGGSLTKLISAAGFQFKGTGWYVTDYARKDRPSGSDSKESSSNGGSEKSDKSEKSGKSSETKSGGSGDSSGKKEKSSKKE
jgi:putative FmdB family regulatory protein